MIKKLEQKIFFIIMISLSILVGGIIITFSIFNYRNTLNTSGLMMNRFLDSEMNRHNESRPNIGKPDNDIEDFDEDESFDKKQFEEPLDFEINIEGLYYILVKNGKIVQNTDTTQNQKIEEYAIKIANSNKESGIIDKYVYKTIKTRDGTRVTIMEDENTVNHMKLILIFSTIAVIISLGIIYIIAKKISKTIVKPVEETLEKQKQFISDASHELKTPLAVIEANADVLENEVRGNKWLKYIQNEIESMDKLINELLLLAKIENVDSVKEYKQIDISEETEITTSMFESMAYEKNVDIKTEIQPNVVIKGNKEDFEHVLSTLIDNAIKHSNKDVIIKVKKDKTNLFLQVENTGEPIPEEDKDKIFERFYRVDKSRNRNEKRYGLGLAIAKSIVDKYNGKINVECSNGVTKFKVEIPI